MQKEERRKSVVSYPLRERTPFNMHLKTSFYLDLSLSFSSFLSLFFPLSYSFTVVFFFFFFFFFLFLNMKKELPLEAVIDLRQK